MPFARWFRRTRRTRRTPHPAPLPVLLEEERFAGCGWFDSSWELRHGLAVIEDAGRLRLRAQRAGAK